MNPSTTTARPILILAALVAVIAGLLAVAPAQAEPRAGGDIVGTWEVGQGQVTVTGSGGSYTGKVSKTITGFLCQHPIGETIWTMTGSGPEYPGEARFDFGTGCPGPMSTANFTLISADMLGVAFVGPTGMSATMYLGSRVASTPPDDAPATGPDTTAPVVKVITPRKIYSSGQKIPIQFRVTDDSGTARVSVAILSGGQRVARGATDGYVKANGQVQTATTKSPVVAKPNNYGPYYFCVSARDKAGNTSELVCEWMSIKVPLYLVSNGCGGAQLGEAGVVAQNWLLNERTYGGYPVVFSRACDLHDAGYAGVTVSDPFTKKVTDFRTFSRLAVDEKFLKDLRTECSRYLDKAPAADLAACKNGQDVVKLAALAAASVSNVLWARLMEVGAYSYYDAVRKFAQAAFDDDSSTVEGEGPCVPGLYPPNNCRPSD